LLAGSRELLELLNQADYVATSVICELEYLAFPNLAKEDEELFEQFREQVEVTDLCSVDTQVKTAILELRREKRMKLPDAIIAASAKQKNCTLITADKHLLKNAGINNRAYSE
jgi:predicted nucleic acid-binding protein